MLHHGASTVSDPHRRACSTLQEMTSKSWTSYPQKTRKPFRPTKGASKARRDQMNEEIRQLCQLLPLPAAVRARLSYLHVMALTCVFARRTRCLPGWQKSDLGLDITWPGIDLPGALGGFLLVATTGGKLVHISKNVSDFLGFSMVDLVSQGDSLYDVIDPADHMEIHKRLHAPARNGDKVTFVCRMVTSRTLRRAGSRRNRVVEVTGHRVCWSSKVESPLSGEILVAMCRPLAWPGSHSGPAQWAFCTWHELDMKYRSCCTSTSFFLEFQPEELSGSSWYRQVHPDHLSEARMLHSTCLSGEEVVCEGVLKMVTKSGQWLWVQVTAMRKRDPHTILCTNSIISEQVAKFLLHQTPVPSNPKASSISPHVTDTSANINPRNRGHCTHRSLTPASQSSEVSTISSSVTHLRTRPRQSELSSVNKHRIPVPHKATPIQGFCACPQLPGTSGNGEAEAAPQPTHLCGNDETLSNYNGLSQEDPVPAKRARMDEDLSELSEDLAELVDQILRSEHSWAWGSDSHHVAIPSNDNFVTCPSPAVVVPCTHLHTAAPPVTGSGISEKPPQKTSNNFSNPSSRNSSFLCLQNPGPSLQGAVIEADLRLNFDALEMGNDCVFNAESPSLYTGSWCGGDVTESGQHGFGVGESDLQITKSSKMNRLDDGFGISILNWDLLDELESLLSLGISTTEQPLHDSSTFPLTGFLYDRMPGNTSCRPLPGATVTF
uniref:neuronal PAS domain-containing protein 4 n=1 Tax=Myxine glutinosa TaxID=7769 RepID=UPI00359016D3